ncbi:hypothetical protein CCP2SC5_120052 [Azospirillaceae bacterium]
MTSRLSVKSPSFREIRQHFQRLRRSPVKLNPLAEALRSADVDFDQRARQNSQKAAAHSPNTLLARTTAFALALGLIGCAVSSDPLTPQERAIRASADHIALFSANVLDPLPAKLSLPEVLARAIKHNLENRLRAMDSAVALGMAELGAFELLPQITSSAGYTSRSNSAGSTSLSVATGQQSLEPSTSQEQRRQTANLGMVWNVLDFGVSYLRARQQSDRVLIAEERRRKAVHTILQQGRLAFWRVVIAERLQTELTPLMEHVRFALALSRKIEDQGVQSPARTHARLPKELA